jgi:hypothetical protein
MRASLAPGASLERAFKQFDEAAGELAGRAGGVISIYYHPTEFVTTEFWDGVNFARGANRERSEWRMPRRRTVEDSERCYGVLRAYVEHMKGVDGVRFVTAREMLQLYGGPAAPPVERARVAAHLAERQTFLVTEAGPLSAADMLVALLGMKPRVVDGPTARIESTLAAATIPRPAFERAKADAASFIEVNGRLPAAVWVGSAKLAIADFAATLAGDDGFQSPVSVRKGNPEFEKYVSRDPKSSFDWVIHPEGFRAPELLELGRLQGWTLKPARLR